jgi:predicted transcriptional regulator YheO
MGLLLIKAMNNIVDERPFLTSLFDLLAGHFGENLEVVLHQLNPDGKFYITNIKNGYITGRKEGDPDEKHGLLVSQGVTEGDNTFKEILFTKDGRYIKSSTNHIKDKNGKIIGMICINQDITKSVEYEKYLNRTNGLPEQSGNTDMNAALDNLIQEGLMMTGKHYSEMTKEEKLKLFKFLDDRGVFLIAKSGPRVCQILKISTYTLYNYLNHVRKENN